MKRRWKIALLFNYAGSLALDRLISFVCTLVQHRDTVDLMHSHTLISFPV